ncbi:hypothetical protein AV530_015686 [Patagioenas fasciata monilis]|uniref:Uncharacterized protein n=1 Tax=Patagioenas fasciata monilis TaxID=372326 RepID=A0A1V4KIF0_PATFA|nr:hypothetical protein AV530_015686 [Patagioenas fasciata monilis]
MRTRKKLSVPAAGGEEKRAFSKRLPCYETLWIPASLLPAALGVCWEEEEENKLIIYKIIAGFVVMRLSAVYKNNNLFVTSVK